MRLPRATSQTLITRYAVQFYMQSMLEDLVTDEFTKEQGVQMVRDILQIEKNIAEGVTEAAKFES